MPFIKTETIIMFLMARRGDFIFLLQEHENNKRQYLMHTNYYKSKRNFYGHKKFKDDRRN